MTMVRDSDLLLLCEDVLSPKMALKTRGVKGLSSLLDERGRVRVDRVQSPTEDARRDEVSEALPPRLRRPMLYMSVSSSSSYLQSHGLLIGP